MVLTLQYEQFSQIMWNKVQLSANDNIWSWVQNYCVTGAWMSFHTSDFIIVVIITWTVNLAFLLMLEHDITGIHT